MSEFMYQLTNDQRLIFLAVVGLVAILITRFIYIPIANGYKNYSWMKRITLVFLIEASSIFLIQTLFFAEAADWNGWFARKIHLTEFNLIDVVFFGFPGLLLALFSVIGLVGGIIIFAYPLFRRTKEG